MAACAPPMVQNYNKNKLQFRSKWKYKVKQSKVKTKFKLNTHEISFQHRTRCWTRVRLDQPGFACDSEPGCVDDQPGFACDVEPEFDSTNPCSLAMLNPVSIRPTLAHIIFISSTILLAITWIDWLHFSLCAISHGVKSIDYISACVPTRMESNQLTAFQLVCQLEWSQVDWLHFSLCASSHGVKSIDYISACVPSYM